MRQYKVTLDITHYISNDTAREACTVNVVVRRSGRDKGPKRKVAPIFTGLGASVRAPEDIAAYDAQIAESLALERALEKADGEVAAAVRAVAWADPDHPRHESLVPKPFRRRTSQVLVGEPPAWLSSYRRLLDALENFGLEPL